jgi:predicted transcriptional regulator
VVVSKQRTVRVSEETHRALREIASESGESMTTILERAVDRYWREVFLRQANAEWARIVADPEALKEIEAEDALWEVTFADGLQDEP